jgi:hypothetical protein
MVRNISCISKLHLYTKNALVTTIMDMASHYWLDFVEASVELGKGVPIKHSWWI